VARRPDSSSIATARPVRYAASSLSGHGHAAPARVRAQPSWLLNQFAIVANRSVAEALTGIDARRYHYSLLAALDEMGASSQADVSRATSIDRSDMVATINELVDRGFVARTPDPADRRRNVIILSGAGRRQLRKLDRLLGKVQEGLLAPLSPDEREQLVDLLTRLVGHHTTP
jgi:MarR family transcriptional regulator, lower aerobic nicotinate degradation pathway regulator